MNTSEFTRRRANEGMDSLAVNLLFLYRFYTHADPWGHLSEILNSIKQDLGPAERMGYTLIQP
jgi:hypothetical protein